jgi:subfamily B ATP-binding cassette protein HlyB/CyaB
MTPLVTKEAAYEPDSRLESAQPLDAGIVALSLIASYYRVAADPGQLRHQLALTEGPANAEDLVRAANLLQLKSRIVRRVDGRRLKALPLPAILELQDGGFAVLGAASEKGKLRLVDPLARVARDAPLEEAEALSSGVAVLVTRRLGGAGIDPRTFGFHGSGRRCCATGGRWPTC